LLDEAIEYERDWLADDLLCDPGRDGRTDGVQRKNVRQCSADDRKGLAARRGGQPTGAVIDGLTLRSTARSARAAYDRAKRNKGSKLHLAVDALAHLLALHVTPANGGDAPAPIADVVQVKTGESARSPPSIRLYGRQATGCGGRTRRRSRGRKLSAATLA